MHQQLRCPYCGFVDDYEDYELVENYPFVNCHDCGDEVFGGEEESADKEVVRTREWPVRESTSKEISPSVIPFDIGDTVVIINEEHPWNGEIAKICGLRHKHCRLDVYNQKLWVPFNWVRQTNVK
jgi:DNA-directed RNA polymerase subunit RPC12/RpoP